MLQRLRVRPLAMVATGLVLVVFDSRIRSVDLLPDVVGWIFVAAGASLLAVPVATAAALVAAVLSLGDLSLPYRFVFFDAMSGEYMEAGASGAATLPRHLRWEHLSPLRGASIALAMVAGSVSIAVVLHVLASRARAVADARSARELSLATVAACVSPVVFVGAALHAWRSGHDYDPVWTGTAEYAWLASALAVTAVALVLMRARNRAWALPARRPTVSPWQDRQRSR